MTYTESETAYGRWLEEHLSDQEARERDYRAVGEWLTDHYAPPVDARPRVGEVGMSAVLEAIRFAEEYGYNRWQDARNEYVGLLEIAEELASWRQPAYG